MRKFLLLFTLAFLGCSGPTKQSAQTDTTNLNLAELYPEQDGCLLLYNLKTSKFEYVFGEQRCRLRTAPCSTFKIPLAVMAFDSKTLKDENSVQKWDGKPRMLEQWNKDHTAASWMKESVVWYSQALTRKMGRKKISNYLEKLDYGNKDFSGSLEEAWLTDAFFLDGKMKNSLKISAYEQITFLEKLWKAQLPVSSHAIETTKKITYLETSPNGVQMHGKTGSGFMGEKNNLRIGWFVAYLTKNGEEYLAVSTYNDKVPQKNAGFGSALAKENLKKLLSSKGLW